MMFYDVIIVQYSIIVVPFFRDHGDMIGSHGFIAKNISSLRSVAEENSIVFQLEGK